MYALLYVHVGSEENIGFPQSLSYKQLYPAWCGSWALNPGPLKQHYERLTTEPSHQSRPGISLMLMSSVILSLAGLPGWP